MKKVTLKELKARDEQPVQKTTVFVSDYNQPTKEPTKPIKPLTIAQQIEEGSFMDSEIKTKPGFGKNKELKFVTRQVILSHLGKRFENYYNIRIISVETQIINEVPSVIAIVEIEIFHPDYPRRIIQEIGSSNRGEMHKNSVTSAIKRAASHVLSYANDLYKEDQV